MNAFRTDAGEDRTDAGEDRTDAGEDRSMPHIVPLQGGALQRDVCANCSQPEVFSAPSEQTDTAVLQENTGKTSRMFA